LLFVDVKLKYLKFSRLYFVGDQYGTGETSQKLAAWHILEKMSYRAFEISPPRDQGSSQPRVGKDNVVKEIHKIYFADYI